MPLVYSWTGEVDALMAMVRKRWKQLVIPLHEVNGGDPEAWQRLNTLYSAIRKKISRFPNPKNTSNYIVFDCTICKKRCKKKLKSHFQLKSSLCKSPECRKQYQRERVARWRNRYKVTEERLCKHPECRQRFIITHKRGKRKFCSVNCRMKLWHEQRTHRPIDTITVSLYETPVMQYATAV